MSDLTAQIDERVARIAQPGATSIRILDDVEIESLPPPAWTVEGVLLAGGLWQVYGQSGHAKGFTVIDLAFSIATGTPWHDHPVRQGNVAYLAAEGAAGLGRRVAAWKVANQWAGAAGVYFVTEPGSLLDRDNVDRLASALAALPDLEALFVDTLNRTFAPGDENSAKDMAAYIAACARLQAVTGAGLGLVHHSGWNADRERGSSALRAACDTVIKISKQRDLVTIGCDKQRDGEEFDDMYLSLVPTLQSCALEGPKVGSDLTSKILSPNEQKALLGLVRDFFEDGATSTDWMAASGLAKSSFFDARKPLCDKGFVRKNGDGRGARYTPTALGRDAIGPKVR